MQAGYADEKASALSVTPIIDVLDVARRTTLR